MKKSTKYIGIVFIVLIIIFAFSSVRGKKKETTADNSINLRVYAFGSISEERYLEEILENFSNKHTNINAELRTTPTPPPKYQTGDFVSGYENLLLADFAAQDPPDIFYLNKGRVAVYVENGALLDLSPYLTKEYLEYANLSADKPIYSLPYYLDVELVGAFSTKHPQETVELMMELSQDRIIKETKAAKEAALKAAEAAKDGAGILDRPDNLFELWNNLALSYQNKEILIDEDAKQGDDYLISHEQAYGYPYMMLRFAESKEYQTPSVVLVLNQQYIENPTLRRNMSQALKVLVRSIHKDIDNNKAEELLSSLGVGKDATDLHNLKDGKAVTFGDYEFKAFGDFVSYTLTVTKLP